MLYFKVFHVLFLFFYIRISYFLKLDVQASVVEVLVCVPIEKCNRLHAI